MSLPAYAMNASNFPEMYERYLVGPLFEPWAGLLLDRAQVTAGHRVLDVACGTGIVARKAKERLGVTGNVVGVDLSPQMLAVARSVAPAIDWREGDAGALPIGAGERFDVVLCQQGLQFFPDRETACGRMREALAPGGRLAVATWLPLEELPFFHALHQVAEQHLGPVMDRRHSFGEGPALAALLERTGFEDVTVETASRTVRFDNAALFVRLNTMALVGMSAAAKELDDESRARTVDAIVADSGGVAAPYMAGDGQGLAFEIGTNVATARC